MATVPSVHSLASIYTEDAVPEQTERWRRLLAAFRARYGKDADFVARSPGRVNVIGEHIDYSLYSVLPMAITADCIIAVGSTDSGDSGSTFKVQVANVLADRFPAHDFELPSGDDVAIDASVHEWTNYFKSGLRGALGFLRANHAGDVSPRNLQVVMDGTVPVGGGLSSSAAFTTASALSVLVANNGAATAVDKTALTELAIVSERSVGVNSGGMDQAASVFGERGAALFVSFVPALSARPVFFPTTRPALCFVIAQSFVAADKFVTGPVNYNLRVVECTLAAAFLNAALNPPGTRLPADKAPLGISLRGFQETYFALQAHSGSQAPTSDEDQLRALLRLVDTTLTKAEGYTREEIAGALGVGVDDLHHQYMARFPVRAKRFQLQQRARHVFGEALRVLEFMALLGDESRQPDRGKDNETASYNTALGALLNASQDSCRELYECSCPELDALCRIARRAGSYGSRLTGAGWGGCSVHLVPEDRVDAVRQAWDAEYYAQRDLTPEQREAAVVVSRPGSGSALYLGGLAAL